MSLIIAAVAAAIIITITIIIVYKISINEENKNNVVVANPSVTAPVVLRKSAETTLEPSPEPEPIVCPKVVISDAKYVWTGGDWDKNEKISTLIYTLDSETKNKFGGSLYDDSLVNTYNALNPGCDITDNVMLPDGYSISQAGETKTDSLFPSESKISSSDPSGNCILMNDWVNLPGTKTGGICYYFNNENDCNTIRGLEHPDGGSIVGTCKWMTYNTPGNFPQKDVFITKPMFSTDPSGFKRDRFGPLQYTRDELDGIGFLSPEDEQKRQPGVAVNESCEYIVNEAHQYIKSTYMSPAAAESWANNYFYIYSKVVSISNYGVVATRFHYRGSYADYDIIIFWAPSKQYQITAMGSTYGTKHKYVPICYNSIYNTRCARYTLQSGETTYPMDSCEGCTDSNLEALGKICTSDTTRRRWTTCA